MKRILVPAVDASIHIFRRENCETDKNRPHLKTKKVLRCDKFFLKFPFFNFSFEKTSMFNFSEIYKKENLNNTANEEENSHHQGIQIGLSIILCLIVSSTKVF